MALSLSFSWRQHNSLLFNSCKTPLDWSSFFEPAILYSAMKNLVAVVLFTTATIYLGARTIEEFNEQFKLKKKELDRAARKELKSKITKKNRYVIALLCVINFGILFITKYFNFFGENINALFHALHISAQIPFLDIFLPLGISFYTLSAISYITDVARGVCKAEKNYFRLLLFLIFFPIITEGPISRYGQLGEELKAEHHFDYKQFCFGAQLIVWGLFQKVLLSDRVNMYVRAIFANHEKYSGFPVIMAILLYTFQLYMDFAGCINIARGSAQLFGITLEENLSGLSSPLPLMNSGVDGISLSEPGLKITFFIQSPSERIFRNSVRTVENI